MGLGDALKFLAPAPSLPTSPSPKRASSSHAHPTNNPSPAPRRTTVGRRVLLTKTTNANANTSFNADMTTTAIAMPLDSAPPPLSSTPAHRVRSWVESDPERGCSSVPTSEDAIPDLASTVVSERDAHLPLGRAAESSKKLSKQPSKKVDQRLDEKEREQKLDDRVSEVYPHLRTSTHSRSDSGSGASSCVPPQALSSTAKPLSPPGLLKAKPSSPHSHPSPRALSPPHRTPTNPTVLATKDTTNRTTTSSTTLTDSGPIPTPASVLLPLHAHTYHVLLYHPISSSPFISSSSFMSDEERVNADVGWDWVVVAAGGGVGVRLESVVSLSSASDVRGENAKDAGDAKDAKDASESDGETSKAREGGQAPLHVLMNAQWPLLRGREACIWKGAGEVLRRGTWIVPRVGAAGEKEGREYLGRVVGVVSEERGRTTRSISTPLPKPGDTYVSPPAPAAYDARRSVQVLFCVLGEVVAGSGPPPSSTAGSGSRSSAPSVRKHTGPSIGLKASSSEIRSGSAKRTPKKHVLKRSSTTVFAPKSSPARPSIRRIASAQISRAGDRAAAQRGRGCGVGPRGGPGGVALRGDEGRGRGRGDEVGVEGDEDEGDGEGEDGEAGYEMVESFEEWKKAQVGDVREVSEGGRGWWMRVVGVLEVGDAGEGGASVGGEGARARLREESGVNGKKEEEGEGERPYSWTPPEAFIPEPPASPSPSRPPAVQRSLSSSNHLTSPPAATATPPTKTSKPSPLLPAASLTPVSTPRNKYRPATTPRERKERSGVALGIGKPIGNAVGAKRTGSSGSGAKGTGSSASASARKESGREANEKDRAKESGIEANKNGCGKEANEKDRAKEEKPRVPTVRLVSRPVVEDDLPDLKPADMTPVGVVRVVSVSGRTKEDVKEGRGKGEARPKIWEMFVDGVRDGASGKQDASESGKKDGEAMVRSVRTKPHTGSPNLASPTIIAPASPALSIFSLSVPPSPSPSRPSSPLVPSSSPHASTKHNTNTANPTPIWSALSKSTCPPSQAASVSPGTSPRLGPTTLLGSPRHGSRDLLGSPKLGMRSLLKKLSKSSLKDETANLPSHSPSKSHLALPPSAYRAPIGVSGASVGLGVSGEDVRVPHETKSLASAGDAKAVGVSGEEVMQGGEGEEWDVLDTDLGLESFQADSRVIQDSLNGKGKSTKAKAGVKANGKVGLPEIRGVPRLSVGFIEKALGNSPGSVSSRSRGSPGSAKGGRVNAKRERGDGQRIGDGGVKGDVKPAKGKEGEKEMKWSEYVSLKRGEGDVFR